MKDNQVRGTLQLQSNYCTEPIKISPIRGGNWHLVPANQTNYTKDLVSLIHFSKRQVWKVYYFYFEDQQGWVLERAGMYLRMSEFDFKYYFGNYDVLM